MTRLTIDESIHEKLGNLTGPVELYDAEGHIIALVTPPDEAGHFEGPAFPITLLEHERRKKGPTDPTKPNGSVPKRPTLAKAVSLLPLDEGVSKKLLGLTRAVDLCDAGGRAIARVTPVLDPALYDLEGPVSREELDRRRESTSNPATRTFTLAEALAELEGW